MARPLFSFIFGREKSLNIKEKSGLATRDYCYPKSDLNRSLLSMNKYFIHKIKKILGFCWDTDHMQLKMYIKTYTYIQHNVIASFKHLFLACVQCNNTAGRCISKSQSACKSEIHTVMIAFT